MLKALKVLTHIILSITDINLLLAITFLIKGRFFVNCQLSAI